MRIYVASDDPGLSYQLREQLLRLGQDCPSGHVVTLERAVPALHAANDPEPALAAPGNRGPAEADAAPPRGPLLVFVVLPPAIERALDTVREIRRRIQPQHLFVVGPTADSKVLLRAIREGAQEYLDHSDLAQELAAAIERLKQDVAARRRAKTILVLSPSGGAGCSTVAVNTAALLARQEGGAILLDLNPEFGDLAALLDLKPLHTVADLCRNTTRMDRSVFEKTLVQHESGLRLLAAPLQIADAGYVSWEGVQPAFSMAADLAAYVIADVSHHYLDVMAPALAQADQILLVLRLDYTSLRNTRRVLEHFEQQSIARNRIRIVANGYGRYGELSAADAQTALGATIAHFILHDPKNVNRANNQGTPVVQYAPSAKISRHLNELALALVTPEARH